MDAFYLIVGKIIVIAGGSLGGLCILGILGELAWELWRDAIWHLRVASKTERLIKDYNRHAPEFREWLRETGRDDG